MKKRRILALVVVFAMIVCALPTAALAMSVTDENGTAYNTIGENMFINGGFEDGLKDFGTGTTTKLHQDISQSSTFNITTETVHSGTNALIAGRTLGFGSAHSIADHFAATPGKSYYLSFWFCNPAEDERCPQITFNAVKDATSWPAPDMYSDWDTTQRAMGWIDFGALTSDGLAKSANGEWVQYTKLITIPATATDYNTLYFVIMGGLRNCIFDDFELYEAEVNANSAKFTAIKQAWEALEIPKDADLLESIDLSQYTPIEGGEVEWASSNAAVLSNTGVLTPPELDTPVTLTATLKYADLSEVYTYSYTAKSLFTNYILALDAQMAEISTAVSANITLPTVTNAGGTVAWESSKPEVLSAEGIFTAPAFSTSVVLTATVTVDSKATQKQYRFVALAPDVVDATDLKARYDFSTTIENGVVTDVSGNGNDATAQNVSAGGGIAEFPGSNAITLPDNFNAALTGDYTVSMWVNMDAALAGGATKNGVRLFDFGNRGSAGSDTYNSLFLGYKSNGTADAYTMRDRNSTGSGNENAQTTAAGAVDELISTWKLVTWVASPSASSVKLYVDGTLIGSAANLKRTLASLGDTAGSANGLFIGRTQWYSTGESGNNPDFKGYMDDIRIYGRALEETEIATLYTQTNPKDVIAEAPVTIKFQDAEGNTLKEDETTTSMVGKVFTATAAQMAAITKEDETAYYQYDFDTTAASTVEVVEGGSTLVLKFVLSTTFAKPTDGNMVINGDFEMAYPEGDARIPFWTVGTGAAGMATAQMTTANFTLTEEAGNHYIKAVGDGGANAASSVKRFIELKPNTSYSVSFKIKVDETRDAWLGVSVTGADGIEQNTTNVLPNFTGTDDEKAAQAAEFVQTVRDTTGGIIPDGAHLTHVEMGDWQEVSANITTTDTLYYLLLNFRWLGKMSAFDDFKVYEQGALEDTNVTVKYVDEAGNELKAAREIATNVGRTVSAEASDLETIEKDGDYYFFIGDEDSTKVVAEAANASVISLVFKKKTITNATVELKANVDYAPTFPETIEVTFDDASTETLAVAWDAYDATGKSVGDVVSVEGTIAYGKATANVTIYPALDYATLYPEGEFGENTTIGGKYKALGENLIENGTFADGDMTGWTTATGTALSDTASNWKAVAQKGYGGSYGIANGTSGGGGAATTMRTYFPVEGGKSYYLSFYANNTSATANGNPSWMNAAVLTNTNAFGAFADAGIIFKSLSYGGFNSWSNEDQAEDKALRNDKVFAPGLNHIECVFNVPAEGATQIMVSFGAWTAVETLYLSNFVLCEIAPNVAFDEEAPAAKVVVVDGADSETYYYNANEEFVLPEKYDASYVDYTQFTQGAIDGGTITINHPVITLTADSVSVTGVDSFAGCLVTATMVDGVMESVAVRDLTFDAGTTSYTIEAAAGDKIMFIDKATLKPLAAAVVK